MSRRHFEAAAQLVAECSDVKARAKTAHAFAEFFARQAPRFDRERFLRACGL